MAELLGLGEAATAEIELWSSTGCVGIAAVLVLPLVWLRDVGRLACGALVGDAAIIFGLGTVAYYAVHVLAATDSEHGGGEVALGTLTVRGGDDAAAAGASGGLNSIGGQEAKQPAAGAQAEVELEPHLFTAFSLSGFPLFFGSAIFSFEGIALILPMQAAMARPQEFPTILKRGIIM